MIHAVISHGSPVVLAEALALGEALICRIAYLITNNCSHVDRAWFFQCLRQLFAFFQRLPGDNLSLSMSMPRASPGPLYHRSMSPDLRELIVALSAAWGCRLSYNFWRKAGYNLRYED